MFNKNKFEVGDVVMANVFSPYKVTKAGWIGKVTRVYEQDHLYRELGKIVGMDFDIEVNGPGAVIPLDVNSKYFDKMPTGTRVLSDADAECKKYEDREMTSITEKLDRILANTEELGAMIKLSQKPKKGRGRPRKDGLIF